MLSYEALSDGVSTDDLVRKVMAGVAAPEKPLQKHVA
jgi:hypothetical protein